MSFHFLEIMGAIVTQTTSKFTALDLFILQLQINMTKRSSYFKEINISLHVRINKAIVQLN